MLFQKVLYWMPIGEHLQPVWGSKSKEFLFWQGRRYTRYPLSEHQYDRDYFKTTAKVHRQRLHRDVWEHCHGQPVPDAHDVHHGDSNPLNNAIWNLTALTREAHMSITHKGKTPSAAALRRQAAAQKLRWRNTKPRSVNCCVCGVEFKTKSPQARFCSNRCTCHWHYRKKRGDRFRGAVGRKPSTMRAWSSKRIPE